jgi:hypothetical protein
MSVAADDDAVVNFDPERARDFHNPFRHPDVHLWVRCGGGGGVYRASAFPSIAGISLRCRELAVWAKNCHCDGPRPVAAMVEGPAEPTSIRSKRAARKM